MTKPAEQELTPENYQALLIEYQRKYGQAEGAALLHQWAVNQGFRMNGNAVVSGVKWVHGEVSSDGVLVRGLNAREPNQLTLFPTPPGQ